MDYSSPLLYSRYFPKLREAAVEGLELQVAVLLRQYQPGSVIKSHYNCFIVHLKKHLTMVIHAYRQNALCH